MVIKDETYRGSSHNLNFNHALCLFSEQMDNTGAHFENITSPSMMSNRHSPSIDDKANSYYSTSPTDNFQRSNSQSSLSGTMSPQEYTELRSPIRQESSFFSNSTMFDPSGVPNSGINTYPAQSFGIFGGNGNVQQIGNSGMHMMNAGGLDKSNMQQSHSFYTHEPTPPAPFHGTQLPSPNSHRGNMAPLGLPSITSFPSYRPYPQINEVFGPTKQEFYMQSPFYPGYPNYW